MNPEEFKKTFNLPFAEAESFFKDKLNIPTGKWDDLSGAAHARGFMSAGAYQADLLADLRKMTDTAIAGGMDIREFRQQFRPLVDRYGWQLKGGGPAWRSDLIWRTNIQSAYQAGRWQQFEDAGVRYLMYVHNDAVRRPRPNHVALDGKVFPRNDPFWSRNYPPQGFGCRCRAVPVTEDEYRQASPQKKQRPEGWEDMADKGWDYNVGLAAKDPGLRSLAEKFEKLPTDIAHEWMKRWVNEPAFARFVEGKINEDFPVAVLQPEDMEALGANKQTVWMSAETLKEHLVKHPNIGIDDYRLLPEIIANGEVYVKSGERLIYLRKDGKLYRAAVKTTRDKNGNYMLTLFETSDDLAELQVKSKYQRIR